MQYLWAISYLSVWVSIQRSQLFEKKHIQHSLFGGQKLTQIRGNKFFWEGDNDVLFEVLTIAKPSSVVLYYLLYAPLFDEQDERSCIGAMHMSAVKVSVTPLRECR